MGLKAIKVNEEKGRRLRRWEGEMVAERVGKDKKGEFYKSTGEKKNRMG